MQSKAVFVHFFKTKLCFEHLCFKMSLFGKKKSERSLVTIEIQSVVLGLFHTLRSVQLTTGLLLQSNRFWFP